MYSEYLKVLKGQIAPPGFEPGTRDPESRMIDHFTMGL